MKRTVLLILAIAFCISLAACKNAAAKAEPTLTKEQMLATAEITNFRKLNDETQKDPAGAKALFCDKALKMTGFIVAIEADHVKLGAADPALMMPHVMDVYLSADAMTLLKKDQLITVLGTTTDTVGTRSVTISGTDYEQKFYTMTPAYLISESYDCTIQIKCNEFSTEGKAGSYICDQLKLKPLYLPEGMDITAIKRSCILKYDAKIFFVGDHYIIRNEVLIEE